jgi:hypothetical protein
MSAMERLKKLQAAKAGGSAPATPATPTPQPSPAPMTSPPAATAPVATPAPQPAPVKAAEPLVQVKPVQPTACQTVQPKVVVKHKGTTETEWYAQPIEEEEGLGIMIYGGKNCSKTTTALSVTLLPTALHPEPTIDAPNEYTVACLSFDLQTNRIKKEIYKNNPNIVVFDPLFYRTKETDQDNLDSATKTYNYVRWLLTEGPIYQMKPHFILIDGLEIFKEVFEMAMKQMLEIPAYGKADWSAWRKRTDLMDDIDICCKRLAKKVVMYTSYTKFREVQEKGSNVITLVEPNWAGNTKSKTGIVIRVEMTKNDSGGREYLASVEGSKVLSMPTTSAPQRVGYIDEHNQPQVIGIKALGTL